MRKNKKSIMYFFIFQVTEIKIILCAMLLLLLSCTSVKITSEGGANEQIKAENRIMKKNLTLALRENSVLKDENILYKGDNSRLNTRIKLLESEMGSLQKKYEQDIALLNEKYENLNKKNIILEQESSFKLQELTSINKALEQKMTGEITQLNENIRKQEEAFNRERAGIETAFLKKELEYQKQLTLLKKEILTATVEMESLKTKLAESESNLSAVKSEIIRKDELNRELKLRIDSLVADKENKKEDSADIKKGNP